MKEIKQILIEDENYPESLKKIANAPKVLYYKGTLPQKNEKCIAVVGTRRPSPYGQQAALQIVSRLVDSNLTIVSGMAPGVDTFSHRACLEKNKRTIAVLGTGLNENIIYPKQNLELSRKIIETGGCLISELPPETRGSNFTFPKRNRIISALSLGVLVVEAKEKSGSLITAEYAKKQGKRVFAVPGPVFSSNSRGPNRLIKSGAILTENANDILEELCLTYDVKQEKLPAPENEEEKLILQSLQEETLHIDKIIEKTKLNAQSAGATLALMEISGKVRNLGGNIYGLV